MLGNLIWRLHFIKLELTVGFFSYYRQANSKVSLPQNTEQLLVYLDQLRQTSSSNKCKCRKILIRLLRLTCSALRLFLIHFYDFSLQFLIQSPYRMHCALSKPCVTNHKRQSTLALIWSLWHCSLLTMYLFLQIQWFICAGWGTGD